MHEFQCCYTYDSGKKKRWTGSLKVLNIEGSQFEFLIKGRGSAFQVILGYSTLGNYLCIPSLNIGCGLAYWSDIYWNTRQLSQLMSLTDAVTIATALDHYGHS